MDKKKGERNKWMIKQQQQKPHPKVAWLSEKYICKDMEICILTFYADRLNTQKAHTWEFSSLVESLAHLSDL